MSWCWHRWGKWVEVKRGQIITRYADPSMKNIEGKTGEWAQQERTCSICGKLQIRRAMVQL